MSALLRPLLKNKNFVSYAFDFLNSPKSKLQVVPKSLIVEKIEKLQNQIDEHKKRYKVRTPSFSEDEIYDIVLAEYDVYNKYVSKKISPCFGKIPRSYRYLFSYSVLKFSWYKNTVDLSCIREGSFPNSTIGGTQYYFELLLPPHSVPYDSNSSEYKIAYSHYPYVLQYAIENFLIENSINVDFSTILNIYTNETLDKFIVLTKNSIIFRNNKGNVEYIELNMFENALKEVSSQQKILIYKNYVPSIKALLEKLSLDYNYIKKFLNAEVSNLEKLILKLCL